MLLKCSASSSDERLALVRKWIAQAEKERTSVAYNRDKYLSMVARLPRGMPAEKGRVERNYPLVLSVNGKNEATCDLIGGIGYVRVTFTWWRDYRGFDLWLDGGRLDQSVHGNDFWQAEFDEIRQQWRLTFNVPRTASGSSRWELRKNGR